MDNNTKVVLLALIGIMGATGLIWAFLGHLRWCLSATIQPSLPMPEMQHVHTHYYEAVDSDFDDDNFDEPDVDEEKEGASWN